MTPYTMMVSLPRSEHTDKRLWTPLNPGQEQPAFAEGAPMEVSQSLKALYGLSVGILWPAAAAAI